MFSTSLRLTSQRAFAAPVTSRFMATTPLIRMPEAKVNHAPALSFVNWAAKKEKDLYPLYKQAHDVYAALDGLTGKDLAKEAGAKVPKLNPALKTYLQRSQKEGWGTQDSLRSLLRSLEQKLGILLVSVESAQPLKAAQSKKIRAFVRANADSSVNYLGVREVVKPELGFGIKLQAGDYRSERSLQTLLDGYNN